MPLAHGYNHLGLAMPGVGWSSYPYSNLSASDLHFISTTLDYYFSDENLTGDFHLKRSMLNDGWVTISTLLTYPRMQQVGADINMLRYAVMYSNTLQLDSTTSYV